MTKNGCLACGKPLAKEDSFCRYCGSAVNSDPVGESAATSSRIDSSETNQSHSEDSSSANPDNGVIAALDLGGGKTLQAGEGEVNTTAQMKNDLRGWGLLMIFWGILSLIFTKYLDPVWGIIIIVLGIVNLLVTKRIMFVINGLALITVGIMNIISTIIAITSTGISSFWVSAGILQVVWGFQEMSKFGKFSAWRAFSPIRIGSSGDIGRFAVIPVDRQMIETLSSTFRQKLEKSIGRVARFWLDEGQPSQAEIMISGFDDDPRELYEILKVCNWAKQTVNEFPVLPYMLTPTALDRFTAWLCGPVSREDVKTEAFLQIFNKTRTNCLNRAILEAPAYFKNLGSRQSTFELINQMLISGEYNTAQVAKGGHLYTAAVRTPAELRKFRRNLPWKSARNAPLLFILGLVLACVIMAGSFFIAMRLISGSSSQPLISFPTLGKPEVTTTAVLRGKLCWTYELTNYNGNRSQVWDEILPEEIKTQYSFTQFKDEVVKRNPGLENDGFIFSSQKTYLLPELCK